VGEACPPIHYVHDSSRVNPVFYSMGILVVLTLGVKPSKHEADHTFQSSAKVKNAWRYTSTPPYIFMTWQLITTRDSCNCVLVLLIYTYATLSFVIAKEQNKVQESMFGEC
jgi:hypothetical protein